MSESKKPTQQTMRAKLQELTELFGANTTIGQYTEWLMDTIADNWRDELFLNSYLPMIQNQRVEKQNVFLSVIMRTQGKRPNTLREALQCLYAQTDRSFEVLLIGHKLNSEQLGLVQEVLDEQEETFRQQIRFFQLDTGTRTTPLNFGFANAHGTYVSILDDDDLVMEDWIEQFHKAAQKTPGRLLHAYVLGQKWEMITLSNGETAPRAVEAPMQTYCRDFDLLLQVKENRCPPMGLSFPAKVFQEWGFIFDETLTTTEDWDYMMRVAFLIGVTDIDMPTSVYRLWTNAESSATVHTKDEWIKNYRIIQKKFEKIPIILEKGRVNKLSALDGQASTPRTHERYLDEKLYLYDSTGYSEQNSVTTNERQSGVFSFRYTNLSGRQVSKTLRWDPASYGHLLIREINAKAEDREGNTYEFEPRDIRTNGEVFRDGYLFLADDPQMYFTLPENFVLDKFSISGRARTQIDLKEISKLLKLRVMPQRIKRRMKARFYPLGTKSSL